MKLYIPMLFLWTGCSGLGAPVIVKDASWSDGVTSDQEFVVNVEYSDDASDAAELTFYWSFNEEPITEASVIDCNQKRCVVIQDHGESTGEWALIVRQRDGVRSSLASEVIKVCPAEMDCSQSVGTDDGGGVDTAEENDSGAGGGGGSDDRNSCIFTNEFTDNRLCIDSTNQEMLKDWCDGVDSAEYSFHQCESACFEKQCSFVDVVPTDVGEFVLPKVDDLRIYAPSEDFLGGYLEEFGLEADVANFCEAVGGDLSDNPEYDAEECEESFTLAHCELMLHTGTSACFDSEDVDGLSSICGDLPVKDGACPVEPYVSVCMFDGEVALAGDDDPGMPAEFFGEGTPPEDLRFYSADEAGPRKTDCESGGGLFTKYGCTEADGDPGYMGGSSSTDCLLENCAQMEAVLTAMREDTDGGNYYFNFDAAAPTPYRATCRFDAMGAWMKVAYAAGGAGTEFLNQMSESIAGASCSGATDAILSGNTFNYGFCGLPVHQLRICQGDDCLDSAERTAPLSEGTPPPSLSEMYASEETEATFGCKEYEGIDLSIFGAGSSTALVGRLTASSGSDQDIRIGLVQDCEAGEFPDPRYAMGVGFSVDMAPAPDSAGSASLTCMSGVEEITSSGRTRVCDATGIWVR